MKKLLVIFAHPDDESFGPCAATLAKYAREGAAVHYLCATRGEAGTVASHFLDDHATIADLRTAELQRAARILGLADVHFLPYRDSGMTGAPDNNHPDSLYQTPLDEIAQAITYFIQRIRPDVIITHDAYGWYGHPDHIKCYQAVRRAYENLYGVDSGRGMPGNMPHLYVSTFPKWLLRLTARLMPLTGRDPHRCGQNQDIDLTQIASWQVPAHAKINVRRYLDVKTSAAACHASQLSLTETQNPVMRYLVKRVEQVEYFQRLFPLPAAREPITTDFFPSTSSLRRNEMTLQTYQLSERENIGL